MLISLWGIPGGAMKAAEINALRMRNQMLIDSTARTPGEVVARMGAVQAQDYGGALWSVGMRMREAEGATEAVVEAALADGSLVRTWPMRRTYHFVAAADLRWMLALLAPRALAAAARNRALLEIDDATLNHACTVVMGALAAGVHRTREDLVAQMEAAGIATDGQRGIHMLVHMAQSGLICMGPRQGKAYTFVALESWVAPAPAPEREEALGLLAVRYFTGHGPATVQDLARWAGITAGDARTGVAVAGKALAEVKLGKSVYLMGAEAAVGDLPRAPHARLLPGFDEYLLGYADRSTAIAAEYEPLWCPGGNGMFKPFVVAHGKVVGLWARKLTKKRVAVTIEPLAPLAEDVQAELEVQAARYGRFWGVDATIG